MDISAIRRYCSGLSPLVTIGNEIDKFVPLGVNLKYFNVERFNID
jgi:hypothetical protein